MSRHICLLWLVALFSASRQFADYGNAVPVGRPHRS
jgi:hypothetical protein